MVLCYCYSCARKLTQVANPTNGTKEQIIELCASKNCLMKLKKQEKYRLTGYTMFQETWKSWWTPKPTMVKQLNLKNNNNKKFQTWRQKKELRDSDNLWPLLMKKNEKLFLMKWWNPANQDGNQNRDLGYAAAQMKKLGVSTNQFKHSTNKNNTGN